MASQERGISAFSKPTSTPFGELNIWLSTPFQKKNVYKSYNKTQNTSMKVRFFIVFFWEYKKGKKK